MIGAGEGFWFSFREQPGRITYTLHLLGDEIEVGEASSVSEMCTASTRSLLAIAGRSIKRE